MITGLTSGYRYGFNGKENDNEVKGEGAQQDYGMRIYDPRVGRFLSVDPLQKQYPELTPYQFSHNSPIDGIDLDGLERMDYRLLTNSDGTTRLQFVSQGPSTRRGDPDFWNVEKQPPYIRLEYNGEHYYFKDARTDPGGGLGVFNRVYNIGEFHEFVKSPEPDRFESDEESSSALIKELAGRTVIGLVGEASNRSMASVANKVQWRGRYTTTNTNKQVAAANNGGGNVPTGNNKTPSNTLKGMNNPATRTAANIGNRVHYDQLNGGTGAGLPTELTARYPHTAFVFAPRGASGPDVQVVGGMHPSAYPGSNWTQGNNFGDFKPGTPSGSRTFKQDMNKGKFPVNTQRLDYDPATGNLK